MARTVTARGARRHPAHSGDCKSQLRRYGAPGYGSGGGSEGAAFSEPAGASTTT